MTSGKKIRLAGVVAVAWVTVALVAEVILAPHGAVADEALAPAASPGRARQGFPEPVLGSLRAAFGAYEAARSDLAADRLAVVPVSASALAGALRLALEEEDGLAGQVQSVILEAALTAESLAQAKDLAQARVVFGEVSRLLLLLAGGEPRLAEGWHVFACPMVETFAKWMQPTEALENPYMGPAMPKCGFATDWSVPARSSAGGTVAGTSRANGVSGTEPQFKPGISGLKMVDVRDHKFLWREIDVLQVWERGDRITVREYRSKAIEKTAHFLELDNAAADEFVAVASEAVASVRESFFHRQASGETSGVEARFSSDLQAAAARLASVLQEEPRHQLFAPGCKKWLLKLAFGPREAKEARESRAG